MKPLLIILIGAASFSCGRNTAVDALENPTKKIKVLLESFHDPVKDGGNVDYGSKISDNTHINRLFFDRRGRVVERSIFNSLGDIASKETFRYDENGDTVEHAVLQTNGSVIHRTTNKFDSSHLIVESLEFDEREKLIGKQISGSDSMGNHKLTYYRLLNNTFIKTTEVVSYDNRRDCYTFINGVLTNGKHMVYDDDGNLQGTIQDDPIRNEQSRVRYTYDEHGNKIGMVALMSNLITSKVASRYDSMNNIIETSTYGVMGNMISNQKHVYEFDAQGNWTRQVILVNNKPSSVILHKIEYY